MGMKTIFDYWEQVEKNPTKSYKEFFEKEEEFLKDNVLKNSVVLDIGCGTGKTIKILSPIAKEIVGIDNDKSAIEKCKNNLRNLDNVRVFLEDAEKMHFKDNSFDVVICMGATFDNLDEARKKILLEIKRVLKDKGIFILSVYNENALEERLKIYKKISPNLKIKEKGRVIFNKKIISEQFTGNEINSMLKKVDFKILDIVKGEIFYLIKAKK